MRLDWTDALTHHMGMTTTRYQVSSEDGNHVQTLENYTEAQGAARAMSSRLVQLVYVHQEDADEDDFEVVSAPSA